MKIAVVTERIEAWRGGAETSTMELARQLAALGHDVHVITASRCPSPPDLTIHMIQAPIVLKPLRTSTFVKRAARFLESNAFDIVHAVVPLPSADVYQPRGGLLGETITRNVEMRGTATRRFVKRAFARLNLKHKVLIDLERDVFRPDGPCILAVSEYVARQCKDRYGVGGDRVRIVFNGVTVPDVTPEGREAQRREIREQYGIGDDTLLLLFVAHNLRLKGIEPLLAAAGRLVADGVEDFRILVVGRDNPVRYLRLSGQNGLSRFVTFAGPTQRIGAFYHAADVCVHPTYYDPCSRVVLEALARGVPCITTRFNGAAEVMTSGQEGFVIDSPDDVDELVQRIKELRSSETRRRMAGCASALRDRISMTRHVRELDAVYKELAASRRHSRSA